MIMVTFIPPTRKFLIIAFVLGITAFLLSSMVPWTGIPLFLLLYAVAHPFEGTLPLVIWDIMGTAISVLGIIFGAIGWRDKEMRIGARVAIVLCAYCAYLFLQSDFALILAIRQ
ncbi:MAG TPA: hypothetical protein VKM55_01795 [Candidatus Lokiarchaeia archaeon]|nr:hypothetical protein [Candidatus Lokiarchaeia archaeon]